MTYLLVLTDIVAAEACQRPCIRFPAIAVCAQSDRQMVATVMYEYIRLLSTGRVCPPVDNSARSLAAAEEQREPLRSDCDIYRFVRTLKHCIEVVLKKLCLRFQFHYLSLQVLCDTYCFVARLLSV